MDSLNKGLYEYYKAHEDKYPFKCDLYWVGVEFNICRIYIGTININNFNTSCRIMIGPYFYEEHEDMFCWADRLGISYNAENTYENTIEVFIKIVYNQLDKMRKYSEPLMEAIRKCNVLNE